MYVYMCVLIIMYDKQTISNQFVGMSDQRSSESVATSEQIIHGSQRVYKQLPSEEGV